MWMLLSANWSKLNKKANIVLKSCSTNQIMPQAKYIIWNSFRNRECISAANFLMRIILLPRIGNLFLPKATENQYSQYIKKTHWEAETKAVQFFLFSRSHHMFQLVFPTSQITVEVTELLLKQRGNKIWEWYKSPDFSALISQNTLFWKTWIDHVLDPQPMKTSAFSNWRDHRHQKATPDLLLQGISSRTTPD